MSFIDIQVRGTQDDRQTFGGSDKYRTMIVNTEYIESADMFDGELRLVLGSGKNIAVHPQYEYYILHHLGITLDAYEHMRGE